MNFNVSKATHRALMLMHVETSKIWSPALLRDALSLDPAAAYRSGNILSSLRKSGKVEKLGRGLYRLKG